LNGFAQALTPEQTEELLRTFNSIEWILIIETRCGIRHVVSLSIPLNGFHDSALLGSYVWACFAFNSIEWILAFDAVTEHVNITFNSIEWIQGLTKEYALEHPLHVLSIPLNGFGTL